MKMGNDNLEASPNDVQVMTMEDEMQIRRYTSM